MSRPNKSLQKRKKKKKRRRAREILLIVCVLGLIRRVRGGDGGVILEE